MRGTRSVVARLLAPVAGRWPFRQLLARPSSRRIVLVTIVKDEFETLLEWVAWHRSRGFSRFVIGDHESRDGTTELLEALEVCGVLRRHHVPTQPGKPPQRPFYNRVVRAFGHADPILGFIDADEFVMGEGEGNLARRVARLFRDDRVSAVGLNWRVYGSSGAVRPSAGPLVLRFNGHAARGFPANRFIKSFALRSRIRSMDVHHAKLRSGRYVDVRGRDLAPEGEGARHRTREAQWGPLFVAHYVTKSRREHQRKKARRGSAAKGPQGVKGAGYFEHHDRNERFSSVPPGTVRRARREEDRLLALLRARSLYYRPCFGAVELNLDRRTLRGWLAFAGPALDAVTVTVRCGTEEWRVPAMPTPETHQPEPRGAALRKLVFELTDEVLGRATPEGLEVRPTGSCTRLKVGRFVSSGGV